MIASLSALRQDVHTHFDSHMRRADVPYEVTSTFDAAGLFVGASIACVFQPRRVSEAFLCADMPQPLRQPCGR